MAIEVKICGINSPAAADAAVKARADFAGLVFHPGSPRNLTLDQAKPLADRMRGQIRLAVLLSDPRDEEIAAAVRTVRPDLLQLHGGETPARLAAIRAQFGVAVMKAIAIADASDFAAVPSYEKVADRLLFDAKAPAGTTREGGHGAAFDWQLLRNRSFTRPWFLAGGLKPDNVARALQTSGATAVDVSSGVETAPGLKSADLIREFVAAARAAEYAKETQP